MSAAMGAAVASLRWPDLPLDLLRDISGRFHVVADFVRFHAVCKPWRDALPPPASRPPFLPWLLAPCDGLGGASALQLRCVFSKKSCRAPGMFVGCNRVASADGTAASWFLTNGVDASLINLLTGAITPLPRFREDIIAWAGQAAGIVSGDGTILVYCFSPSNDFMSIFRAVILRPGDAVWTDVRRILESPTTGRCSSAAYHDGKIVVSVDTNSWCFVMPSVDIYHIIPMLLLPYEAGKSRKYSYVLESRGELLLASVLVRERGAGGVGLERVLSVSVYALKKEANGRNPWRVVRRDRRSLGDRVLFLGCPASFAVDAAQFGGDAVSVGGCAYFVVSSRHVTWTTEAQDEAPCRCRVYKYSFRDGKAALVEKLPPAPGWDDERCTWLAPHPAAIAPIHYATHVETPPDLP